MIEVANRDGLLQPGRSAIVNLSTARRENVVRIPNAALAFRPAPAVADAVGQTLEEIEPQVAKDPARRSRSVVVWTFRNDRFEAVTIELGIADDTWTELVTGPIAPGDRLITTAAIRRPGA